ncbi:MAG: chemotaxis protein CheW [bacterium]
MTEESLDEEQLSIRDEEHPESADRDFVKTEQDQYVVFTLKDQVFGIDIQKVMEVQTIDQMSDVFHTPPFVVGVVNIRGDVIALLDIGLFFGMEVTDWDDDRKMVIVQEGTRDAGFLAEEMKGVQWIDSEDVESPPPTVEGISSEWIDGIIQRDGSPLIILDINRFLAVNESRTSNNRFPQCTGQVNS